jgi:hypothetical protein
MFHALDTLLTIQSVTGDKNDTGQIAGTDPSHKEGDRIIDWV